MNEQINKINEQITEKMFKLESFESLQMPAMRFIGKSDDGIYNGGDQRLTVMQTLDAMTEHKSGFDYDTFFFHWNGQDADVAPWQGIWGRFMKADTPVPEGFVHVDLVPYDDEKTGVPYISKFSYAIFSGNLKAMHKDDIYLSITRDITANDKGIPYPRKFWNAEVFINGVNDWSTGCLYASK